MEWIDELLDRAEAYDDCYRLRVFAYNLHENIHWAERMEESIFFAKITDADCDELVELIRIFNDRDENSRSRSKT